MFDPGLVKSGIYSTTTALSLDFPSRIIFAASFAACCIWDRAVFRDSRIVTAPKDYLPHRCCWFRSPPSSGFSGNGDAIQYLRLVAGIGLASNWLSSDTYVSELGPPESGRAFALIHLAAVHRPRCRPGTAAWWFEPRNYLFLSGWRWVLFLMNQPSSP